MSCKGFYRIPKVSKKQAKSNRELSKLKSRFPNRCAICGIEYDKSQLDGAHLLPKSIFPEYKTSEWILVPLCRGFGTRNCHKRYDDDLTFRKKQIHLIDIVRQHDELAANRYFDL